MKTAEELIQEQNRKLVTVSPETTIYKALEKMIQNKIGSILVESDGELVGIWTERDFLRNSLDSNFDPHSAVIKEYMHKDLLYANYDESIFQLMDKFLGLRVRQLLIKKGDRFIGLLSSGDVIRENLKERAAELKRLNQAFSWEYYENWNW